MTTASNAAQIQFPQCTGGSNTITWFAIGTAATGTGNLLYRKALPSSIAVSNNIQPVFNVGQLTISITGDVANAWISDLLNLLFNNVAAANIGNAGGLQPSTVAGSLYLSLHTADPGAGGDQTVNEATYTSYARVAVARTTGGWTVA